MGPMFITLPITPMELQQSHVACVEGMINKGLKAEGATLHAVRSLKQEWSQKALAAQVLDDDMIEALGMLFAIEKQLLLMGVK